MFNYDNIGGKIKNLAKWGCRITILLMWTAAYIAFVMLVNNKWTVNLCWIPLVGAIVGPVLAWIGSWVMYAYGELVEDIHAMRKKYYPIAEEMADREVEEKAKQDAKKERQRKAQTFFCPHCSAIVNFGDTACSSCGQEFDWDKA